jgi:hypothetical protein
LRNLTRELFQTEVSASSHCRREAKRLGAAPPARVLREAAGHAEQVLAALPALAERHDLPVSAGGMAIGKLFSVAREHVADHFIEAERSYRGTLLGMRHGVDVVQMVRHVSTKLHDDELVAFCTAWLSVRVPIVSRVEEELSWFAEHAGRAMEPARPLPLLGRLRHV